MRRAEPCLGIWDVRAKDGEGHEYEEERRRPELVFEEDLIAALSDVGLLGT